MKTDEMRNGEVKEKSGADSLFHCSALFLTCASPRFEVNKNKIRWLKQENFWKEEVGSDFAEVPAGV